MFCKIGITSAICAAALFTGCSDDSSSGTPVTAGMDEAGIAAAVANGLKAAVHASANWKWRDSQGTDHYGEAEFRSRFDRYVSKAPAKEQHASTGKSVEKKKKYSLKKSF